MINMSAITIITFVFGGLLNLAGLFGFFSSGATHPLTLLPCALGLFLIACAVVSTDPKLHRQAMKFASMVTLFGFAAYVSSFSELLRILKKVSMINQGEIIAASASALFCFILLARYFQEFLVSRTKQKKKDGEGV